MASATRLTAAKVRQIREPGKYYDGNGLFLRVEASGSKRWVQRVTINGKRCEIGLGSGELVTLAEARELASINRKAARAGGDPIADRRRDGAVPTFNDAVQQVYALHEPSWRNKKHAAQFQTTLEQYVSPVCGHKKISNVTSQDVMTALMPIWINKAETARRGRVHHHPLALRLACAHAAVLPVPATSTL